MSEIVDALIAQARENDLPGVDVAYVERYISARKRLTANPNDASANEIVQHFKLLLPPFGRFTLSEKDYTKYVSGRTPEESRARDIRMRDAFLALVADINPEAVTKCQQAQVFRPELLKRGVMGTEGIRGFKQRTGLTDEAILAMSPEKLMQYR